MRQNYAFSTVDFMRFLGELPQKIVEQAQSPIVVTQTAIVLVGALAAWWLARLARSPMRNFASRRIPAAWSPGFLRGADYLSFPLQWLAILTCGLVTGLALGLDLPLIEAAFDLVLAWIVIRLLSFAIKSPAMSAALTICVFAIAALNILELYRPLLRWMARVHLYKGEHASVSLLGAVDALIVMVVLLWLTRAIQHLLQRRIVETTRLTPSLQMLVSQILKIFLPAIAVVIALQTVGVDLTTLTVAFGAIGLGVGLGLQKLVSNFVSGLSLIVSKTIKPGDTLKFNGDYGWVTGMGARYVTLRTLGGIEHLIPNDYFVENGVENWSYSDATLALTVEVGISYDADPHRALALCLDAAAKVSRVLADPPPFAAVKEFADSAIVLSVSVWISDPRAGIAGVKSDLLLAIWDAFKAAGIVIPYPQRDVRIVSGAAPPG